MEFLCDTNYILFPASDNAQNKRLYFYIDNELVYDIVLKLDNASPDYKLPVNMRRFKSDKVKIISNPYIADSNLNSLRIKSKTAIIHNINVSELNSIH